jgi:hypothetical protein
MDRIVSRGRPSPGRLRVAPLDFWPWHLRRGLSAYRQPGASHVSVGRRCDCAAARALAERNRSVSRLRPSVAMAKLSASLSTIWAITSSAISPRVEPLEPSEHLLELSQWQVDVGPHRRPPCVGAGLANAMVCPNLFSIWIWRPVGEKRKADGGQATASRSPTQRHAWAELGRGRAHASALLG